MKKYENEHYRRVAAYEHSIKKLYDAAVREMSKVSVGVTLGEKPFKFDDYPALRTRANKIIREFGKDIIKTIEVGVNKEWEFANVKNDILLNEATKGKSIPKAMVSSWNARSVSAQKAFRERVVNGMDLSDRIWRSMGQFKQEMEMSLDIGIRTGKAATRISQDIRPYLEKPDKLFRKVRDQHGQLVLSKNAKAYNPGRGMYRSSYKNALRVARTETNMAYRASDHERWKKIDFVVGLEIRRSNNPYECDICSTLAGRYPKDFKFVGWHPNCYDEQTEVLTNKGWLFFKDVTTDHKILSLNPDTRNLEWVNILLSFGREHNGKMVHFHNKTLDCLVTPEHEMVYLNKSDGKIKRATALEYTKGKGAFARGANWIGENRKLFEVNDLKVDFNLFAEFMGYWLSDGSTIRKSQISIAQQDTDPNKANIIKCIEAMGFRTHSSFDKISFYNTDLCTYLKQFKTAYYKYIPSIIKNSSSEQIKIFLDAFISCDGSIRPPRNAFIGDRGTVFMPKSDERMYFTTSPQMASDIGELILKIGKRPSYRNDKSAGKLVKFRNGTYKTNYDCITITECKALTATVFSKDIVDYKGMVYDVTLDKNAIMYIRRNGKCFWGSNCRCYSIPILSSGKEFDEMLEGKQKESKFTVKRPPKAFEKWVNDNHESIQKSKSKPYFITDNQKVVDEITKGG